MTLIAGTSGSDSVATITQSFENFHAVHELTGSKVEFLLNLQRRAVSVIKTVPSSVITGESESGKSFFGMELMARVLMKTNHEVLLMNNDENFRILKLAEICMKFVDTEKEPNFTFDDMARKFKRLHVAFLEHYEELSKSLYKVLSKNSQISFVIVDSLRDYLYKQDTEDSEDSDETDDSDSSVEVGKEEEPRLSQEGDKKIRDDEDTSDDDDIKEEDGPKADDDSKDKTRLGCEDDDEMDFDCMDDGINGRLAFVLDKLKEVSEKCRVTIAYVKPEITLTAPDDGADYNIELTKLANSLHHMKVTTKKSEKEFGFVPGFYGMTLIPNPETQTESEQE